MTARVLRVARSAIFFLAAIPIAGGDKSPPPLEPDETRAIQNTVSDGRVQAEAVCQACHLFPEPDLLDKKIWRESVLPKMKYFLGVEQMDVEKTPKGSLLKASGKFPSTPMIPKASWEAIVTYYLETAPDKMPPAPPKGPIQIGLKWFQVERPRFRRQPPLTTLVSIDPTEHVIYTADAQQQDFTILDSSGQFIRSFPVGNIPVSVAKTSRGFFLTCIGHFFPDEERRGQLILLEWQPGRMERKVLLSELARPADLQFADLNGDGRTDFVLSQFGYLTGRVSWFENRGPDHYAEHVLLDKAGAVQTAVGDFNGDGKLDIAVLMGQEIEALLLFEGDGRGHFSEPREVFKKPPSYGHNHFEVVDFNQDGRPDFLVTNGDNGDYESPPKPYHGIRLYSNDGHGKFHEAFFYPLHGAVKAVARDFQENGKLDIAAISFFPDFDNAPRESFVYLENLGGMKFAASTFPECISGRWLTMDVGDVDGDGDLDIVLGSLVRMPTEVPAFLKEAWEKNGPSVLILKNQLRERQHHP